LGPPEQSSGGITLGCGFADAGGGDRLDDCRRLFSELQVAEADAAKWATANEKGRLAGEKETERLAAVVARKDSEKQQQRAELLKQSGQGEDVVQELVTARRPVRPESARPTRSRISLPCGNDASQIGQPRPGERTD